MIFQEYHLLRDRNLYENIALPLYVIGTRHSEIADRVENVIDQVGLVGKEDHTPDELSGGEQQRACIARALVKDPEIILADEPTGNLDRQAGDEVMEIFRDLNREQGLTVVMVTHDETIAEQADRTIHLVEGRVQTM